MVRQTARFTDITFVWAKTEKYLSKNKWRSPKTYTLRSFLNEMDVGDCFGNRKNSQSWQATSGHICCFKITWDNQLPNLQRHTGERNNQIHFLRGLVHRLCTGPKWVMWEIVTEAIVLTNVIAASAPLSSHPGTMKPKLGPTTLCHKLLTFNSISS